MLSMVNFISDLHFGHKNICKYRPQFKDPEEHDETIIINWNSVIKKRKQQIWVLGDFLIHNNKYDMAKLVKRLNGTIRVVAGNHDYMPYYKELGIEVMNGLVSRYGYWLSHCPIPKSVAFFFL
jgi:calcineurin-like phosphoesterase family protein